MNPDPWAGMVPSLPANDSDYPDTASSWDPSTILESLQTWDQPVEYMPELPNLVFPESHDPALRYGVPGRLQLPGVHTRVPNSHSETIFHFGRFSNYPDTDSDDSMSLLPISSSCVNHHGRPRRLSDPLNPFRPDYNWPNLSIINREIFGPEQSEAWCIRQQDVNARAPLFRRWDPHQQESMDFFLATQ